MFLHRVDPEKAGPIQTMMISGRFARLPNGAVVVNTARGVVVGETALLNVVQSEHLSAVGLDCFQVEPCGNPAFAEQNNIFVLPRIGRATRKTRDAMRFRALDNLDAFFAGRPPGNLLKRVSRHL